MYLYFIMIFNVIAVILYRMCLCYKNKSNKYLVKTYLKLKIFNDVDIRIKYICSITSFSLFFSFHLYLSSSLFSVCLPLMPPTMLNTQALTISHSIEHHGHEKHLVKPL